MARVDIHFHLLPGVDDGPVSMDQSVVLARAAVAEGTQAVVVTPHVRIDQITDVSDLPERVSAVEEELRRESIHLRLLCGAELGWEMVGRLTQAELETVALGPTGARWVLVETPFRGLLPELSSAIEELHDRGFGVVLAHPERAPGVLDDGARVLRAELAKGTLAQINAWSLTGHHGAEAQTAAQQLVAGGLVSALASDAHGGWRMPALTRGHDSAIALGLPPREARRLIEGCPTRLLARGLPVSSLAAA